MNSGIGTLARSKLMNSGMELWQELWHGANSFKKLITYKLWENSEELWHGANSFKKLITYRKRPRTTILI